MKAPDPFGGYIRGLCALVGAQGASVYLPSPPGPVTSALLSHQGGSAPIPELADLAQSAQFLHDAAADVARMRELARGLATVEFPSVDPEGRLFGALAPLPARVPDRRQSGRHASDAGEPGTGMTDVWLGFRMGSADPPLQLPPRVAEPRTLPTAWGWLVAFVGELVRHGRRVSQILDDPVTGLPGRAEFQVDLERAVDTALAKDLPVSLLMVNPDGFAAVNERMSREAADEVIREVAVRLRAAHRSSDVVARYGSLVFASVLVDTGRLEGMRRTEEVLQRLQERAFVGGRVPLRFSVGLASFEPGDTGVRGALDLTRRADAALSAAKRAGGGRIRAWQPGAEEDAGYVDRLSGIFTGHMSKDYRNMAVLSDTISVLAESAEPQTLAERVVNGLQAAMKPERVGLFEWEEGGEVPRLVFGVAGRGRAATDIPEGLVAAEDERRFIEEARRRRRPLERREGGPGPEERLAFAVPLVAGEEVLGVLYLAGAAAAMSVDSSDLVFLEALATQVALALDRARLAERQRAQEEQERLRLQAQVEELRAALQRTQILYRSRQMEALLDRVRRVAPTDATVLITGESGTGKEVFARAIHELSRRRDQPFVVVDCGAIPTSLIESELFGHERGAFTGALQRQPGRLVQADRGTLLLDEIGEMPLEAQSRLLRFVQERHVTPVGGHSTRTVDVRVLAATNRDLLAEVDAGRFRADLFHRLNVVRLEIPPLRSRPDDVGHLAHHFCRMYSLIYGRPSFSFSPEAEAAILRHTWTGNVRELQNRVMRAVILGQGTTLTPADLGLDGAVGTDVSDEGPGAVGPGAGPLPPAALPSGAPWAELRVALRRQVEGAVKGPKPVAPLGRWLVEDLVLEAGDAGEGVASRAADLLGMPVTTFRRRLETAGSRARAGWSPRPASWPDVRACLSRLLRDGGAAGGGLLRQVPQVLLEEVLAQVPEAPRTGAALLGLSLPTYRRRCEALAAGLPPPLEPDA
jgi:diguanylate cyclase (GGDEF)-like protein